MKLSALLLVVLLSVILRADSFDIGDRIARTFLVFKGLPLTVDDAVAAGWEQISGACESNFGIGYWGGEEYSVSNPIIMYYTPAGQVATMGVVHYGKPLPDLDLWWVPTFWDDGNFIMRVTFRDPSLVCSNQASDLAIGDRLIVNQGTLNFSVPVTDDDAAQQQWTAGNCIGGMGTHWFYDLATHPNLTYQAEQTAPIVPMYNNGQISAFFVETTTAQLMEPFGCWEGPFISALFCKNFCPGCQWNHYATSTMHFLLQDHSTISCSDPCNPLLEKELWAL